MLQSIYMNEEHYYTTSDQGLGAYLLYNKVEVHRVDQKEPKRFQVTFFHETEDLQKLVNEYTSGKEIRMSPLHYSLALKQFKAILHSPPRYE